MSNLIYGKSFLIIRLNVNNPVIKLKTINVPKRSWPGLNRAKLQNHSFDFNDLNVK